MIGRTTNWRWAAPGWTASIKKTTRGIHSLATGASHGHMDGVTRECVYSYVCVRGTAGRGGEDEGRREGGKEGGRDDNKAWGFGSRLGALFWGVDRGISSIAPLVRPA